MPDREASPTLRVLTPSQHVVASLGYPGLLLFAIGLAYALLQLGRSPAEAAGISTLCSTWLAMAIEKAVPETPRWVPRTPESKRRSITAWLSTWVLSPLLRASFFAVFCTVGPWLAAELGFDLWPRTLPIVVQVVLALLVADLGAYAFHRWMHLTRWGWRIHVVHHSAPQLHMNAEGSSHPINATLTQLVETTPLLLLGVTPEAFVLWNAFMSLNGILQHSNIPFRPGIVSTFIATSEAHRWHHSIDLRESNTNFGNSTVIWDRVFGTFALPQGRKDLPVLGIEGTRIPQTFWMRLATPWLLDRFES